MSDTFKQSWHPQLLGANAAAALNAMPQVDCVPLTWVLEKVGLTHVNFFVLDVEGGELQVLQAIDFSKVTMDVIVIEADGGDPAKEAAIKALLSQHGYTYDGHVVRNDWFSRTSFEKSTPTSTVSSHTVPSTVSEYAMTAHLPAWASDAALVSRLGTSFVDRRDVTELSNSHSQDAEDIYAYAHYFYGRGGGSFVELGALDGLTFSNTVAFTALGWKGVHIEASPASYSSLVSNRPEQVQL
jgi:hypothetical protein